MTSMKPWVMRKTTELTRTIPRNPSNHGRTFSSGGGNESKNLRGPRICRISTLEPYLSAHSFRKYVWKTPTTL